MTITIIYLADDNTQHQYLGAVQGSLSREQALALAKAYNAVLDGEPDSHEEEGRTISFREVEAGRAPPAELINVWK